MQSHDHPSGKSFECSFLESSSAGSSSPATVKCECGVEIILVPDLRVMSKAIEAHVDTHRKMEKDCSKTDAENEGETELEVERIENYLITEVFKKASQQKR